VIALGNSLNQLGIKRVTGNLVLTSNFAMNYKSNPSVAGHAEARIRRSDVVKCCCPVLDSAPWNTGQEWLFPVLSRWRHSQFLNKSCYCVTIFALAQIIKEMNIYSNNEMAEMLAQSLGSAVRTTASCHCRWGASEIQLVNGSGLGVENRISPRAVYVYRDSGNYCPTS